MTTGLRFIVTCIVCIVSLTTCLQLVQAQSIDNVESVNDGIEKSENCTPRSINDFPKDIFTTEQRAQGAVILHAFLGFYCFLLTAFVCNDYLLPALDCICSGINISADVAGATFLATASCFPELFVSVVGTFLTESDLGVGTVVGSAVFNTFATTACGALSARHGIQLEWQILSRDCIIYVISVGLLVLVMWDGLITWYEATVFIVLFVGYLVLLFSGEGITRWYNKIKHLCWNGTEFTEESAAAKPTTEPMLHGMYKPYVHGELIAEYRKKSITMIAEIKSTNKNFEEPPEKTEELVDYVEPDTPFVLPTGNLLTKLWFYFTWPLRISLFVTIPDTRYKRFRSWYFVTFFVCTMWIVVSSYMVSWMMTVVGDTMGIPDSVMGITFLSAGGNMPELVSIVILSRQGNGDMAMSNTLGANTLDILLCLGLPWLIKSLMSGKDIEIISGALSYSVLSIIVCVIFFYSVTAFYKFKLNKKVGAVCLVMYVIFLIFAISVELNVFYQINLPMCPR
ncbi:PREDICTED: sodium/potassium/calcium exchanger 3-like isoform X1 [Polistes dominula]|uniref:Sodium/potassium/calcium exchanger 3-like isoform X1 n=1 Tax=Polistes dominula TaxID=743375 RepID=A0ABM1IMJ4_POLDO|nr:PREDICTED: sodium/potassium/calcium exchanger 3-like isoform X1 [Polistes dominula]